MECRQFEYLTVTVCQHLSINCRYMASYLMLHTGISLAVFPNLFKYFCVHKLFCLERKFCNSAQPSVEMFVILEKGTHIFYSCQVLLVIDLMDFLLSGILLRSDICRLAICFYPKYFCTIRLLSRWPLLSLTSFWHVSAGGDRWESASECARLSTATVLIQWHKRVLAGSSDPPHTDCWKCKW